MGDIMEKETRMSKYKDLREKVREEVNVAIKKSEPEVLDDDFLAFITKKESQTNDVMDTTTNEDNHGKKVEILNKVKTHQNDEVEEEKKTSFLSKLSHFSTVDKTKNENNNVVAETKNIENAEKKSEDKKVSFLEKLAALSNKEESVEKEEETIETKEDTVLQKNLHKDIIDDEHSLLDFVSLLKEDFIEEQEESEEVPEVKNDIKMNKIIDYIIVGLMIVLFIFLCMIVKQLF